MTTYPSAPVDQPTADALALINMDLVHRTDRDLILDAIQAVADPEGLINPNRLRQELHGRVYPKTIGATIQGLAKQGHIEPAGWTVTQGSTTGNNGRPARVWRWIS